MTLKRYLILMGLATAICWLSWLTVIYFINPKLSGLTGFICFFSSLFFSLLGTFALAGLIMRLIFRKKELPYRHIGVSLRQSLWFATLCTVSLALLGQNLFTWWSISLLLVSLIILEGFFLIATLNNNTRNKINERRALEN